MSDTIEKVFGIDLGTTYSTIAYVDEYGKPVVIPNADNQHTTPSVIFFDGDNIVVGEVAKESAKLYPDEVVSFIKRSMGEENFIFEYNEISYRPEEISSYILRKLAKDAEKQLGIKVKDVVITCPAYFGVNEREATKKAGEIADLNVLQIINEPTAAAITYGATEAPENRVVLVYDLGGGTFDITMITVRSESIEVLCTGGDHNLGGKDWDDRIVAHLVREFQTATGSDEDILEDPDTCQDMQLSAERCKKMLSQRDKTPILITHAGERVKVSLDKSKFEEITRDLLERTVSLTQDMLQEARKKGADKFDEIILVGGATRMPQVADRISKEFGVRPRSFDPDEAVAKGAAILGWKLSIKQGLIQRVAEKSGKKVEDIKDLEDEGLADVLNEVEQLVADETGYTLTDVKSSKTNIRDVTSKSFGVIAHDADDKEIVFNLILKNTEVPLITKKSFGTAISNQEAAAIEIMENNIAGTIAPINASMKIGTATLTLPDNIQANSPVEINFKLNEEGRLDIKASEISSGRSVNVVVDTQSVIRGEELEQAKDRSRHIVVN